MADLFFHQTFAGSFDKNDRTQPKRLLETTKRLHKNYLFLTKHLLENAKRLTVRLEKMIGRYI